MMLYMLNWKLTLFTKTEEKNSVINVTNIILSAERITLKSDSSSNTGVEFDKFEID